MLHPRRQRSRRPRHDHVHEEVAHVDRHRRRRQHDEAEVDRRPAERLARLVDAGGHGHARDEPRRGGDARHHRQHGDDEGGRTDGAERRREALGDVGEAVARQIEGERRRLDDAQRLRRLGVHQRPQQRAVGELRQREVGHHHGDDGDGNDERENRGDGFGAARPRQGSHAAEDDADDEGADEDDDHQGLRLPGEPAGGEGAHAQLGGEHQQRRHRQQHGARAGARSCSRSGGRDSSAP